MSSLSYHYTGAIHVHSTHSDGFASPEELIAVARSLGLDFLVLTDHDTMVASPLDGWHGNLLFVTGVEVSPPHNHYLAVGLPSPAPRALPPREYVDWVRQAGGVGFLAHPHDRGNPMLNVPSYSWIDWDVTGYDGLEVWNYLSQWLGKARTVPRAVWGLLRPSSLVTGPEPADLALWDRVAAVRPVVGIAGSDAHGYRHALGPFVLRFWDYKRALASVTTTVVLDQPLPDGPRAAISALLEALRRGSCYFGSGLAKRLTFRLVTGSGRAVPMGGTVVGDGPWTFHGALDFPGELALVRGGEVVSRASGEALLHVAARPGPYRLEARGRRGKRLFSNHIYVREGGGQ